MNQDVLIVGAGPVGLCLARSLAACGLRITLLEAQVEKDLQNPRDDGREIAVTHHTRQQMERLGLWQRLCAHEIGDLRAAQVFDGRHGRVLNFDTQEEARTQLGWLVSNHAIRRAAFAEASAAHGVRCLTGVKASCVSANAKGASVRLDNGETLTATLLVAADSRFSETRRALGVVADWHDFGKTMLVLRMRHELAHDGVAWEWFGHGQTLARLPLADPNQSSIVVTLAPAVMRELLALDDAALEQDLQRRFGQRLGRMQVAGPRCSYPLVGTYAKRFAGAGFALVGDTAVGMHPLTAHGFNFGLMSQEVLADEIMQAQRRGQPWQHDAALMRYQRRHYLATRPLYLATQHLAELYTDDRLPARALRKLTLHAADVLPPVKSLVVSGLTAESAGLPAPLRGLWQGRPPIIRRPFTSTLKHLMT